MRESMRLAALSLFHVRVAISAGPSASDANHFERMHYYYCTETREAHKMWYASRYYNNAA